MITQPRAITPPRPIPAANPSRLANSARPAQTDSDSNSLTPPQRILSFMEIAQLRRPAAASACLRCSSSRPPFQERLERLQERFSAWLAAPGVHHGARGDLYAALAPAALGVTAGSLSLGSGARTPAARTKQSGGLA